MEYLVLEAGLGGEFDATNVVKNNLSIFTPIGYDHQNFLGDSLEEIATTKMKSCDTQYILSYQKYDEIYSIAKVVLKDKKEITLTQLELQANIKELPEYLQQNFDTVLNVLKFLEIDIKSFKIPKLFGRFEKFRENIIIDVGHNPLAASAIARELKAYNKKFVLIYNSFEDKDYNLVLTILKPYIKEVQIIDCKDKRIVSRDRLENCIKDLSLNINSFDIINLNQKNYYLVFGSFSVIESFIKEYIINEKR